jgi:methyl-accepting chemotaxis protein
MSDGPRPWAEEVVNHCSMLGDCITTPYNGGEWQDRSRQYGAEVPALESTLHTMRGQLTENADSATVGPVLLQAWQEVAAAMAALDEQSAEMARTGDQIRRLIKKVAISWILTRVSTRPINLIIGRVEQIATGDLTIRILVVTRDEIGTLAQATNGMTT